MNPVSIVVGAAAFLYGIYTLITRIKTPEKFGKLEAMKKAYGKTAGNAIHFVSYTLVPMAVGITFIVLGILGISIF